MIMHNIYSRYIDTAQEGFTIFLEHNLGSLIPFVLLYEPVNLNDYKVVPLYDSRIATIESRGLNVSQITFNGSFTGYAQVLSVQNVRNTLEDRVSRLEDISDVTIQQQKQLVSGSQWRQMNTYLEGEIVKLDNKIESLSTEVDNLKSDVDAL